MDQAGFSLWLIEPDLRGGAWDPGLEMDLGGLLRLGGWLLVGLELARLRQAGPTRPLLLIAIAGAYVGPWLLDIALLTAIDGGLIFVPYPMTVHLLLLVTTAFAVWIAAGAWLDREDPRACWGLLAAALPLYVIGAVTQLAGLVIVTSRRSVEMYEIGFATTAFAAAATSVLALVAFGRLTPVESLSQLDRQAEAMWRDPAGPIGPSEAAE